MKHCYKFLCCLMVLALFAPGRLNAQNYSAWGVTANGSDYDSIDFNGDTLRFEFNAIPAGVYGNARLVIYYEADLGDAGESFTPYTATSLFGSNLQTFTSFGDFASDCLPEDSIIYTFPASSIVANGNMIAVKLYPSVNVDVFCTNNRAKVRLVVDYCTFGTPSQYAFASVSDNEVCPTETVVLSGTPANGTWTGQGVNGSIFDPSSLPSGNYTLVYTATDGIGCTTYDDTTVRVLKSPNISDVTVCYGDTAFIIPGSGSSFIYYSDAAQTNVIDTTFMLEYGPMFGTTTIYAQDNDEDYYFQVTGLTTNNPVIVDQNTLAGDDRGGIAVTPNYVYLNGDNNCVRYTPDLNPASGISLPMRDGIFSDLNDGRLYSLHNLANVEPVWPGSYTVDCIREMDDMLAYTGNVITLDSAILVNGGSAIFAGSGIVIIYETGSGNYIVIDVNTGEVENLGGGTTPQYYGAENWLSWGIAEYDGIDYSVIYRSNSGSMIDRTVAPNGATTNVLTLSNISDMASLTYSRWENAWFWKYEGSGEFGGSTETLGRCDASDSSSVINSTGGTGCYSDIVITVPSISLGGDVTVCQGEEAEFFIGLGFSSISWNGANTNTNTYETTTAGPVIVEAVLISNNCTVTDTAQVLVNPCVGIDEASSGLVISMYPNPSTAFVTIDAPALEGQQVTIVIRDVQGKTVRSAALAFAGNHTIDVSALAGGVYAVTLTSGNVQATGRIVVQK